MELHLNVGLLLNVDYGEPLAKIRAREVLRRLEALRYVGEEEAIDAFYLHYRRPIFGGKADNESWSYFVKAYVSSEYYKAVWPMCRLNPKASREAAVRLLKAYQAFLDSLESGKDRFWRGRGLWLKWSEALRNIRRLFGDPADVAKLYASLRKLGEILGSGRSGDPASLAMSIAADPTRMKLADVIADIAELLSARGVVDPEGGESSGGTYAIDGVRSASIGRLKEATDSTRALYLVARELFAYKAATSTLSVRHYVVKRAPPLYILLDKSGSMYDVVPGLDIRRISVAAALALALWRRNRGSLLRLFDVEVHKPEGGEGLVDVLLRVVPSGGTSLSRAVHFAVEEAIRLGVKRYALALVTDGEDEAVDESAFERAKAVFDGVEVYLVGGKDLKIGGIRVRRVALSLKEPHKHAEYNYGEPGGGYEVADHSEPHHVDHYGLLPKARRA